MEITRDNPDAALENFWHSRADEEIAAESREFTASLVRGATENLKNIDEQIARHATNWQLERMAVVDKNVMRISCFELLFRPDIPAKVSINEAVELAKKYSCPEAGKFVNAILDKIKQDKEK